MLRDLSLQTEEEIKKHEDFLKGEALFRDFIKAEIKNNEIFPSYYKDKEYQDLLEKCHDICNRIYINRNISLNESEIIKCLNEIDVLLREKSDYN